MVPGRTLVSQRVAIRGGRAHPVRSIGWVVGVLVFLLPALQDPEEPDLVGLSESVARRTLDALDSRWSLVVRNVAPESIQDPLVVDQFPTESEPDGGRDFPVNVGVVMPDVVGQSEQAALDLLDLQGLSGAEVSPPPDVDDAGEPATRTVIDQRPVADELVAFGDPVALVVSSPVVEPVVVPLVIDLDVGAARQAVEELGLALRAPPESVDDDIVVTQQPEAETEVAPGAVVSVEVGAPVEGVTVPSLLGLTPVEAREVLGNELVLGPVTSVEPVIDQTPGVGETVPRGSTVTVTQAEPTEDNEVAVPDVVGLQVTDARRALERSGLTTDVETDFGTVARQDPDAGSLVALGTPVVLGVAVRPDDDASSPAFWVVGLTSAAALTAGTTVVRARRRGRSWASRAVSLRPVKWQPRARVKQEPAPARSVTIRIVPHPGRRRTWTKEARR